MATPAVAIATAMSVAVAVAVGIRIAIPVPVALLQGLLARALRAASAQLARRLTNDRADLAGPAATPITSPLPPPLSRWARQHRQHWTVDVPRAVMRRAVAASSSPPNRRHAPPCSAITADPASTYTGGSVRYPSNYPGGWHRACSSASCSGKAPRTAGRPLPDRPGRSCRRPATR